MIIPYSTALTLSRPPVVTYATTFLCVLVFVLQIGSTLTESLMYYPESWNPITMISSSLAHANWFHLLGNMIFFLAFAPALEILLSNTLRYILIMLFIAIVAGISYSISIFIGHAEPLPSLGFSGIVMGMIGLSAFLMPHVRIRVFVWFLVFWKTFYVPAWVLALFYVGMDSWVMLAVDDYGGVNIAAHVAGGLAGYLYGYLWLKERKQETRQELAEEIDAMETQQQFGSSSSMSFRGRNELDRQQKLRQETRDQDRFMRRVYQAVTTHRDSEAIVWLLERYDYANTPTLELEVLFDHIKDWGPSRTHLCLGRLIINRLDEDKRYGRAIYFIEKCQLISPQFILADLSRTIFYATMAIETGKQEVAKNLLIDAHKRYGSMVNSDQCYHLLQQVN